MNHIIKNIYARLSSKLATFIAVVSIFALGACDKSTPPAKVTKEISKGFYYMKSKELYEITEIRADGTVEVGYSWSHLERGTELKFYPGVVLKLEGPAMVGDSFRYRMYFKEVLLESGEIKKMIEKITVESDNQQKYEAEMLKTSTDGDNHPGTK